VVAVTVGMTVLAWTAGQIRTYHHEQGRADLLLLTKLRSLAELSLEQGILAGLTPLRDVFSLGDNLPLLVVATVLLFRDSAERWAAAHAPGASARSRRPGWKSALWVGTGLYLFYRLVSLASDTGDLPLGGCGGLEVLGVPLLMTLSDGIVLAWILVELRNASLGETGNEVLAMDQAIALMPGAALACLAGLPARAWATLVLLSSLYLPSPVGTTWLGRLLRWQLSWGLADVQGAALVVAGLSGAVAWSRGTLSGAVRGYVRLLAAEGGHLVAALMLAGLAAGSLTAVAYLLVLALPPQTWVLAAADSYAHYATLPIGLLLLAAFVELGERALPEAALADSVPSEPDELRFAPLRG
jgi:hypothetical protein